MEGHLDDQGYLNSVSKFITFLSMPNLTFDQILSHMVLVVFAPLDAEAISLRELKSGNKVERIATWGMPVDMALTQHETYDLNEKYPSTETLRYRRTTWINTLPDFGDEYPLLKAYPYTTGAKSFICFPIEKSDTPVVALGVFCRKVIHPNAELESFLRAVGSVLSLYMSQPEPVLDKSRKALIENQYAHSKIKGLTERQLVILRLISESRTNVVISELIGYSESTIRQETVRIFSILECKDRYEAARIYYKEIAKSSDGYL